MSISDHIQCSHCGADLKGDDRFCPLCGEPAAEPSGGIPSSVPAGGGRRCPLCGHQNAGGSPSCGGCGADLGESARSARREPDPPAVGKAVPFFLSWKFTLTAAAVIALVVAMVIGAGDDNTASLPAEADPHDAGMMEEIKRLQERITSDPADTVALLRYANLLYDVRFFERAAEMYGRYLELVPANPDARVDMGIAYFELSIGETDLHETYLETAKSAFLDALKYDPGHQLAHFNLGIIHLHHGDIDGARNWFEKCIAIDPGSTASRRATQIMSQHVEQNPS